MNVLDRLYPYQKEAVTQTFYNTKGIVCLPTGTGKTFCQAAIIANDITLNPNQHRVYVINAPRILLTYQLLKETYNFLITNGIEARYGFVHSGGGVDEGDLEDMRALVNVDGNYIPFSQIGSTTSVDGVKEMISKAKEGNLPIILFSTYHSVDKIELARKDGDQPISILLNDEAHYLVQEQFHSIITELTVSRCYFFTATMINTKSENGRGMNNVDTYGEVLYQMVPREAIDLGKMVKPRIHVITTDGIYDGDDYDRSLSRIINETYQQHKMVLGEDVKAKMLISTKGTKDISDFISSSEYKRLLGQGVELFSISSNDDIGCDVNGVKYSRQDFLSKLKSSGEDDGKEIIVLHYDILTEGIDVSGFTGMMPLRTLNKSKFLQTYGRVARLDGRDRTRLANGEIKPTDYDELNKPYSYILIPNLIQGNEDDKENFTTLIHELRDYGFNPSEDIISSSMVNGVPKMDELGGLNEIKTKLPVIGKIIEGIVSSLEDEEDAKLSPLEFMKKMANMN